MSSSSKLLSDSGCAEVALATQGNVAQHTWLVAGSQLVIGLAAEASHVDILVCPSYTGSPIQGQGCIIAQQSACRWQAAVSDKLVCQRAGGAAVVSMGVVVLVSLCMDMGWEYGGSCVRLEGASRQGTGAMLAVAPGLQRCRCVKHRC